MSFINKLTCNICNLEFIRNFERHLHDFGTDIFACSILNCLAKFHSQKKLDTHVKIIHGIVKRPNCNTRFICNICSRSFSRRLHLARHIQTCSKIEFCTFNECGQIFFNKSSLTKHLKTHRDNVFRKCTYYNCNFTYVRTSNFLNHLNIKHLQKTSFFTYKFNSFAEFSEWKDSEELNCNISFAIKHSRTTSAGVKYIYYFCAHDGCDTKFRKTSRKNLKGVLKLNRNCLSRIYVTVKPSGSITIKYINTHSHNISFEYTKFYRLPSLIKQRIKQQLALGISAKKIRSNFLSDFNNRSNRCNTILGREHAIPLRNIKEIGRKMLQICRLHQDDATSLLLNVKRLQVELYDPILLYKPMGSDIYTGPESFNDLPDSKNIFALGIQTEAQKDIFQTCGKKCYLLILLIV